MKAFLLLSALLLSVASTSCHKEEVVAPAAPAPTQAELLVGKWSPQHRTALNAAGTTLESGPFYDPPFEFTPATIIFYNGRTVLYARSYSLLNGVIHIVDNEPAFSDYTIVTLTAVQLVVTYTVTDRAGVYATYTRTDSYLRL